jgi:hypothetical protein
MDEQHILVGKEVYCFPETGKHTKGFIKTILYSMKENWTQETQACIVDHGTELKTWLLNQLLPTCVCPDGLVRLLDGQSVVPVSVVEGVDLRSGDDTPAHVKAQETSDPLFLSFDASSIPPEKLALAKGRPFMGPDGKKLGDILSVNGTQMVIEVDAYLADGLRKQLAQGKGPAGCVEHKFVKRDTSELMGG